MGVSCAADLGSAAQTARRFGCVALASGGIGADINLVEIVEILGRFRPLDTVHRVVVEPGSLPGWDAHMP